MKYDDNTVHLDIFFWQINYRGHTKKLVVRRCRSDVRKYSFCIRIINVWNSLLDEIISAPSVNTSKNRLDKFWAEQEQEVFYIIKSTQPGIKVLRYNIIMIVYINNYDVGIKALPTPIITLLLLLLLLLLLPLCNEFL